jgi:hypothetical protein
VRSFVAAVLVGLASACADAGADAGADGPDEQSEYVDLYLDEGVRMCAGQLDAYDPFIARIFDVWSGGDPGDFRVAVHVRTEDCPESESCATVGNAWIGSQFGQYHEIAHVMSYAVDGHTATTLQEGMAEALGPSFPIVLEPSRLEMVARSSLFSEAPGGDAYIVGSVLTRFLIERHGRDAFRAYYRAMELSPGHAESDFEREFSSVFGESLDVAWAAFVSERRCAYDFWYCDAAAPVSLPFEAGAIDCSDAGTQGFELENRFAPIRLVGLDIDAPTGVTVTLAHGSVSLASCGDCSQQRPVDTKTNVDSIPRDYEVELSAQRNVFVIVEAGGPLTFAIRESE